MKASIHPKWYPEATVKCACGNVFTVGATQPEIGIEVCANCHPFYTGQMRFLDASGRVDSFEAKRSNALKKVLSKTERRKIKREKRIKDDYERPDSLADLRKPRKKLKKVKKS